MRLIDTHIHLTSPRYTDLPGLVARAQQAGIAGVVAAAVDEPARIRCLPCAVPFPASSMLDLGYTLNVLSAMTKRHESSP